MKKHSSKREDKEQEIERAFQEECSRVIRNEVAECVFHLVSELVKDDKYMDDLLEICQHPQFYCKDGTSRDCLDGMTQKEAKEHEDAYPGHVCAEMDDPREAYEHWTVSPWLADKLEARGEMVARDFMGLTIWGRCTTGQGISMDGVIREIVREMHAAK